MEFHISRQSRAYYEFDDALFGLTGNVIFANFHAVRQFAQKMNQKRDLVKFPEQAVAAGPLNAMGLVDEMLHLAMAQYRKQRNPGVMEQALAWLESKLGRENIDRTLRAFAEEFPTVAVYRAGLTAREYLQGETDGTPNRQVVLEEMLMLWLANLNPAFAPFAELFDDALLARDTAYTQAMTELRGFFDTQPRFGPDGLNLVDLLRAPALAHPGSLTDQLQFMAARWPGVVGESLVRLLSGLDLIKEETKPSFTGPGPAQVPIYDRAVLADLGLGMPGPDVERYSPDRDWMPRLVLMAKNTYVWLDQLSKKYRREVRRLDQIPDEELDQLARWGVTGLWLIGLWERSRASQRIKQLCGNADALPSAYSLYDYRIADDLGGSAAMDNLRDRAGRRGIRMASDMVPNHMGIDSPWVINHPDWFVSLPYPPFPTYTFNGPDLSQDGRVGVFIEDHYYNRTDAAVVFKRLDRWTGGEMYVYHGNDGTSTPWNDTAQLNYLNPEVREAVIQTILHVARQFPVIRFDAAMTLAKRHFQRLWFPEPGTGGAIASRAGLGLTRQQLDQAMPEEFWREVVDRVAREAPDTLLLAEAFWMMEGYFVRTLGMHRVYNSAFMNMLRDEENAKYRHLIKSTLEFDPQILKRYVNFMNNPDERTAVDQFGKGDKYFGVCTLMVTLPGLPMLGHGQIEGFTEKYGMEFRRAMWDEQPDGSLISRHGREIFPLLHKRYLFSDVEQFVMYDFYTADGAVCEDVFAHSNRHGDERALVLVHNKFADVRGWIRASVAALSPADGGRALAQTTLSQGLGLTPDEGWFTLFRDLVTGLEYIRNNRELADKGLYVELDAYKRHVFLDFRQVQDDPAGRYAQIAAHLSGRGVPSVEGAMRELVLQPVLKPFREAIDGALLYRLIEARESVLAGDKLDPALLDDVAARVERAYEAANTFAHGTADAVAIAADIRRKLEAMLVGRVSNPPLPAGGQVATPTVGRVSNPPMPTGGQVADGQVSNLPYLLGAHAPADMASWVAGFAWLFVHAIGKTTGEQDFAAMSRALLDEWRLGVVITDAARELGLEEGAAAHALSLVKVLVSHQRWFDRLAVAEPAGKVKDRANEMSDTSEVSDIWGSVSLKSFMQDMLADADVRDYLGVNRYQGVLWFNKESFERLTWWLAFLAYLDQAGRATPTTQAGPDGVSRAIQALQQAERRSEYQVDKLLAAIE